MAIQIGGVQVISNGRDLQNIRNSTLNGWINGSVVATKQMAEAGSVNDRVMTPLRVKEAINAIGGTVIKRVQRGSTPFEAYIERYVYQGNNAWWDRRYATTRHDDVKTIAISQVDITKSIIIQGCVGTAYEMYKGWSASDSSFAYGWMGMGSAAVKFNSNGTGLILEARVQRDNTSQDGGSYNSNYGSPAFLFKNKGTVNWEVIEFM